MLRIPVAIHIPEDEITGREIFREVGPDFELGNQGTVRIGTKGWRDGDPIFLNLQNMVVRREAGFRKILMLRNHNNEGREFVFDGSCWHHVVETTSRTSASPFQQAQGHWGFWTALATCGSQGIENLFAWLMRVSQPIWVIPLLTLQFIHSMIAYAMFLLFASVILTGLLKWFWAMLFGA